MRGEQSSAETWNDASKRRSDKDGCTSSFNTSLTKMERGLNVGLLYHPLLFWKKWKFFGSSKMHCPSLYYWHSQDEIKEEIPRSATTKKANTLSSPVWQLDKWLLSARWRSVRREEKNAHKLTRWMDWATWFQILSCLSLGRRQSIFQLLSLFCLSFLAKHHIGSFSLPDIKPSGQILHSLMLCRPRNYAALSVYTDMLGTERFYSKIASLNGLFWGLWAAQIRPIRKDAQFCQVYFSHRTFFGVNGRFLIIRSFLTSSKRMLHQTCKRGDFSVAS